MSTGQKIIKYLAIAFGIFLFIAIISAIAAFGYRIINSGVIFHVEGNEISESGKVENMVEISNSIEQINSLNIELKGTELKILKGQKFEVKTDNENIKYFNEDGNIVVKDESSDQWFFGEVYSGIVEIYLPEDMAPMAESNIKVGAGKVYIEKFNTQKLEFKIGAGETTVNNLMVSEECKINGGAGAIHINSGKITNLDLDTGIGATDIKAEIIGNNTLETGVGALNLNLESNLENYRIDVKKGLGDIRCNNRSIPDNSTIGTGKNYINIKGGIGQINIKTNE